MQIMDKAYLVPLEDHGARLLLLHIAEHAGIVRTKLSPLATRLGWNVKYLTERIRMLEAIGLISVSGSLGCRFCTKRLQIQVDRLEAMVAEDNHG